jgi:hypothetical protein
MRKVANTKKHDDGVKRVMIHAFDDGVLLYLYDALDDGACSSEEWYPSTESAEAACLDRYGIGFDDWRSIPDPHDDCQHDWTAPTKVAIDAEGKRTFVALRPPRVLADFNGLFGDLLCLSHTDSATTDDGGSLLLREGLDAIAYEPDGDDGTPAFLVARGSVTASPPELMHRGPRWCLKIDERGVRHVSTLDDA